MNRLRIAGIHYDQLKAHLYPGDGLEAVAIALCSRSINGNNHTLMVNKVFTIPYKECFERKGDLVHWPTSLIEKDIETAREKGMAILKIHCHPGGGEFFSDYDTESDASLFSSVHAWLDDNLPHASCIMLPDGRIFGRFITEAIEFEPIDQILIAGSSIKNWCYDAGDYEEQEMQTRNMQTFGKKTVHMMKQLKIVVVGASGTGSIVIEQLKRYGVGEIIIVDPDHIDFVNLNRIINSTMEDAQKKLPKVDVMERSIVEAGFGTKVTVFDSHISKAEIVKTIAEADILFSCVDSAEGRHVLNLISSFYILPLFDMGVKLDADGKGGIDNIYGTVHYVQPGGSSLLSRNQYSIARLLAEGMLRTNPEEYEQRQRDGYLIGANETAPAVISINMQVAATAVNDFLNRIHPFRIISNEEVSWIRILFGELIMMTDYDETPCAFFSKYTGMGDIKPLINLSELSNV